MSTEVNIQSAAMIYLHWSNNQAALSSFPVSMLFLPSAAKRKNCRSSLHPSLVTSSASLSKECGMDRIYHLYNARQIKLPNGRSVLEGCLDRYVRNK